MGTIVTRQTFTDVLVTAGQTVVAADADSGRGHCFVPSMDQPNLDDPTLVIRVETQIADDQVGLADDKLTWRTDGASIWECPQGKFYRNLNPVVGSPGGALKGKRIRCAFTILAIGKSVTMDVNYSVATVAVGP